MPDKRPLIIQFIHFLLETRPAFYAVISNFLIAIIFTTGSYFMFNDNAEIEQLQQAKAEVVLQLEAKNTEVAQLIAHNEKVMDELKTMASQYQDVVQKNSDLTAQLELAKTREQESSVKLAIANAKLDWTKTLLPNQGKRHHESIFD